MRHLDESDIQLLRKGMERLSIANEIMRFLSDHFRDKYGLTPNNQITPDGEIIEVSPLNDTIKLADGALSGETGVPY